MFGAIFAYIDHLFNIIRPKKLFYMAIDGVAPRAKMNQQRARRFRSAVEAEENLKKAIKNGEPAAKEPVFDSNAITPGTEFMANVTRNLKYYINQKVSQDSRWQKIKVILSGHEVPGEGEHKIMEFIRVQRAQPGYDPNTRHCVYGLDADLIMLGLASHEPHFALLREEVTFGRNRGHTSTDLTKQKFYLLHISLVREYLSEELSDLEDELSFPYDFERILDDFILIMYVIGNDFLPNLPDLHLKKGAFPVLIETFKEALRRSDGYINDNGKINRDRLKIWLNMLSIFEIDNFERGSVDVDWFNEQLDNISRRGAKKRAREGRDLLLKQQKAIVGKVRAWLLPFISRRFPTEELRQQKLSLDSSMLDNEVNRKFIKKFAFDVGLVIVHSVSQGTYTAVIDVDGIDPAETDEQFKERGDEVRAQFKKYQRSVIVEDEETIEGERDLYDKKFIAWKNQYYKEKVGFTLNDEDKIRDMTENYVEGLQWVLYYYFRGVPSWSWYYHYHYAPRISDVARGLGGKIDFVKGQPFKPFQQLMGVLPARSRKLMPVVYRDLMTDPKSPIIDFYPNDCKIDMNGKTAPWEAVVLLSFVDEKRLVKTMEPYDAKLTPEEKHRNSFGQNLIYHYNPQVKNIIKSPLPEWLPDFESRCVETHYELPTMDGLKFVSGLCKGAVFGLHALAGFPTLKCIPFSSDLEYAQLKVFQQPSRSVSIILTLKDVYSGLTPQQFAQQYVGKVVYGDYPYLREYKVAYITDGHRKFEQGGKSRPLSQDEHKNYENDKQDILYQMKVRSGVRFARTLKGEQLLDGESSEESGSDDQRKNHRHRHACDDNHTDELPVKNIVYMSKVVGLAPTASGAYVKVISKELKPFPEQLIVDHVNNVDKRFKERKAEPLDKAFPVGQRVVFLGSVGYGAHAKVAGYSENGKKLAVVVNTSAAEPDFGKRRAQYERRMLRYHSVGEVAHMLHMPPFFLSRITSRYLIFAPGSQQRDDVGLGMKFQGKQLKVLGYTKQVGRNWQYSDLAVATIKEYARKFPRVLDALRRQRGHGIPKAEDIFVGQNRQQIDAQLKEVRKYLREATAGFVRATLSSQSLTKFGVGTIEKDAIEWSSHKPAVAHKGIKGIPRSAVFDPSREQLVLRRQHFDLGDRVVYVADSGKAELFSKGTVVGIRSYPGRVLLQVVFDDPVLTGNRFDGRLKTQRGLTVDSSALLNLTDKQFAYHHKGAKQNNKVKHSKHRAKSPETQKKEKQELLSVIKKQDKGKETKHAKQIKEEKRVKKPQPARKEQSTKKEESTKQKEPAKSSKPVKMLKRQAQPAQPVKAAQPVQQAPQNQPSQQPAQPPFVPAQNIFNSVMGNVLNNPSGFPPQPNFGGQRIPYGAIPPQGIPPQGMMPPAGFGGMPPYGFPPQPQGFFQPPAAAPKQAANSADSQKLMGILTGKKEEAKQN